MILAIDPGTTQSGWCEYNDRRVLRSGVESNSIMLLHVKSLSITGVYSLAIEKIVGMGMVVGQEVFDTCIWIGRFQQAWRDPDAVRLIPRRQVKLHVCGSPQAKDKNIRQALIDKLGPVGTKANPGPLYGVTSHAWSALAIAVTAQEMA